MSRLASLFCFVKPPSGDAPDHQRKGKGASAVAFPASRQRELDNSRSDGSTPAPLLSVSTDDERAGCIQDSIVPLNSDVSRRRSPIQRVEVPSQHISSLSSTAVQHRDMRNEAIMSATLQMVTAISFDGRTVLHQNELSKQHLGNSSDPSISVNSTYKGGTGSARGTPFSPPADLIAHLFSLEPAKLRSMMAAMRAGQPWKRVVQVPMGLSVISNHEECRFGTYVFTDAPRVFLPGGLRHQKRKEMRERGGDLAVDPDFPRGSTLVHLPSLNVDSLSRAATAIDIPESTPSKMALSPSFLRNSPGNPHHIMTPPGRKSTASGFEYSPPDLTRRSKSSLMMNTFSSHVPQLGGESELDSMGMMNAPPSRTMSLLKVAIASQSNVGTISSASNVQTFVTSQSNMQMTGGSPQSSVESNSCCFHEITASTFIDPVTNKPAILLVHTDITPMVVMEDLIMGMSEGQLKMLGGIFPRHVIEYMSFNNEKNRLETIGDLARHHKNVTILFMDIVGFTSMAKQVEPQAVMTFLNQLFTIFDALCDVYGAQKVETAGDCYIAASGILNTDEEGFSVVNSSLSESGRDPVLSACRIMALAKGMMAGVKTVMMPHNGEPVSIRIGIHTGPCVTGLVGTKLPKFSIFGDTMNTASRMESTSHPGHIQVSEATWNLLKDTETFSPTGGIEIKGKGLMPTFILDMDATGSERGSRHGGSHRVSTTNFRPAAPLSDYLDSKRLTDMSGATDMYFHLSQDHAFITSYDDVLGTAAHHDPMFSTGPRAHGRSNVAHHLGPFKKSSSLADLRSLSSSVCSLGPPPRNASGQVAALSSNQCQESNAKNQCQDQCQDQCQESNANFIDGRSVPLGIPATTAQDRSSNLIIAEALAAAVAAGGEDLVVDKKRLLFRTQRSISVSPIGEEEAPHGQISKPILNVAHLGRMKLDPGLVAMCQSTLSFQMYIQKGQSASQQHALGQASSLKVPPGSLSDGKRPNGASGQRRKSTFADMKDNFLDRSVLELLRASSAKPPAGGHRSVADPKLLH